MRGKGNPQNVEVYDVSGIHSHANAEIERLLKAHRVLTPETPTVANSETWLRRVEKWALGWQGVLTVFAIIVAIALGIPALF